MFRLQARIQAGFRSRSGLVCTAGSTADWVALNGEELLSHGSDARGVRDAARAKGVRTPPMVHIPDETDMPSAVWV